VAVCRCGGAERAVGQCAPRGHRVAVGDGRDGDVQHRWTFSSYDMAMVSEEQIQQWAKEAEVGYDVDELKRRGRGRPGRGAEPMQVVAVRLTAEELEALDAVAVKHEMSRSEAIRAALAHFAA
jgi:Ribbon-helix-helix protein, copG family